MKTIISNPWVKACIATALVVVLMLIVVAGCKEKPKVKIDPHAHITADKVQEECKDPAEFYPISRMGYPISAMVMRHEGCLGIEDMFTVLWPGELSETNRVAAKLLMLMYLDFKNEGDSEEKLSADLIKIDRVNLSDGTIVHMAIYALANEKTKQPSSLHSDGN
tara:strand:- start:5375 stop:5866 length:492 start_codon:yes stop_codon:yes gene_type:complete